MTAILDYHDYSDWKKMVLDEEEEIKDNIICFGFELEVTTDYEINYNEYVNNNHTPENLANALKEEFGDLFIYERDGSIGMGVEIISQPMSLKYYLANIDKFKRLLEICNDFGYVSTKGGKCGLHVHFSRSAFGFTKDVYNDYLSKIGERKTRRVENIRVNKTIENICLIMEAYKDEFIKISGRNQDQMRWCNFETNNNDDILEIKAKVKNKRKNGGSHGERYRVVNTTNSKTVEIRLCRGTTMWESFHTRILLLYHLVDIARNYNGLLSFKKIVEWKESDENIQIMKSYIENNSIEYRQVKIDEVKRKVALSLDLEFRVDSVDFVGK